MIPAQRIVSHFMCTMIERRIDRARLAFHWALFHCCTPGQRNKLADARYTIALSLFGSFASAVTSQRHTRIHSCVTYVSLSTGTIATLRHCRSPQGTAACKYPSRTFRLSRLAMVIGRLYYYAATIAIISFCCVSHIQLNWPEKGYHPHSSMGNIFRKPKPKDDEAPRSSKGRKRERSRAPDPRRRRDDGERSESVEYRRRSSTPHPSRSSRVGPSRETEYYLDELDIKPIQRWR